MQTSILHRIDRISLTFHAGEIAGKRLRTLVSPHACVHGLHRKSLQ